MCGIAGKICEPNSRIDLGEMKRMQRALVHRGPDGEGTFKSPRVVLTARRLAIIDVKGGNQPIYNEDKSLVIVGNGEIYNYIELRQELVSRGHRFSTGSDIETALHAYEEYGISCPEKLWGMFALAIYDSHRAQVALIRDRLGEKPLYYTRGKDGIVFASELKSLLLARGVDKTLNWNAIDQYFHFYHAVGPSTMFTHIKKVGPGSILVINLTTMSIRETRYWDATKIATTRQDVPTLRIREAFLEACELTTRSDVPIGISLSGGMDSGSILAALAPRHRQKLTAFTVGYTNEPPSDERKLARKLAKHFKVDTVETEISTAEMITHFPTLVRDCDDPIADIAAYAFYRVYHLAKAYKVKVLLNGMGGDELFWGYPVDPESVKDNILKLSHWWSRRLKRTVLSYSHPNPIVSHSLATEIYHPRFADKVTPQNWQQLLHWPRAKTGLDIPRKTMDLVRDIWLVSNGVTLGDRLSMANSIELRSPFLNHQLIETILTSARAVEAYRLPPKYWLKKSVQGLLPSEVMDQPKRGFTPPVTEWLAAIVDNYVHLLNDGFLLQYEIISPEAAKLAGESWRNMPTYWYTIYQMILLEIWFREYLYGISPVEIT